MFLIFCVKLAFFFLQRLLGSILHILVKNKDSLVSSRRLTLQMLASLIIVARRKNKEKERGKRWVHLVARFVKYVVRYHIANNFIFNNYSFTICKQFYKPNGPCTNLNPFCFLSV